MGTLIEKQAQKIRVDASFSGEIAVMRAAFDQLFASIDAHQHNSEKALHVATLKCQIERSLLDIQSKFASRTDELEQRAQHDQLTGLPGRAALMDRIGQCLRRKRRLPSYNFAVLSLDFDRFKVVNECLGHDAGDQLLRMIAERLNTALRCTDTIQISDDTAARVGGDEFVILLTELTEQRDALVVAQRLLDAMAAPFVVQGQEINSSVSIGIATSDARYTSAAELLRDADSALNRAKLAGKNRVVIFDEKMHREATQRLELERDLRRAVDNHELFLQYQPITDLRSGELIGFEALVRWRHPTLGVVPPDQFIPIAEETGLISQIGLWVLYQACQQLAIWKRDARNPNLWVSVNLSKRQLGSDELVARCLQCVRDHGLRPADIRLEITESLIVEDAAKGTAVLRALKELGFSLLMDDFGTGLSSLSLLHKFPLTGLKIDRAFIRNVNERRDYTAVISAIVILAHNLGLSVTAEGVETQEQLQMLQALNCDSAQGYYFARPLDAAAATAFITAPLKLIAA